MPESDVTGIPTAKIESAIKRIKEATHDISDEYSKEKCIEFLNTSIQRVASLLIQTNYPGIVREMIVHDGDKLPKNYIRSVGMYPLKITNGVTRILDGNETVRFRYFATPDNIDPITADENTEMPYQNDAINEVIIKYAIILALNENEYETSADSAILQDLQQAISGAMNF